MKISRVIFRRILECVVVFRHLIVFMSIVPILEILHIAEGYATSRTLLGMLVFFRYVFWGYWIAEVLLIFCLKHLKRIYRSNYIGNGR